MNSVEYMELKDDSMKEAIFNRDIMDFTPDEDKRTGKNSHIEASDGINLGLMAILVPTLLCGLSLGLHLANPCVSYATGLFWSTSGTYILTVLSLMLATGFYYKVASFCDRNLQKEHIFDLTSLYFSLASTLSWYDFYTYNSNGFAALAAALQYVLTLVLFWVALTAKHKHTCPNASSDNYNVKIGKKDLVVNCFNAFFYIGFLSWLAIIGLSFGMDYQLWSVDYISQRNTTLCL
jgi:hypothetical protein